MHCHHLQHEDNGMMSQFVIGHGGLDPAQVAPCQAIKDFVIQEINFTKPYGQTQLIWNFALTSMNLD